MSCLIQADGEQYFDNSLPFMSYKLNEDTNRNLIITGIIGWFLLFVILKTSQYLHSF
jgi:hypothetical protein